VNQAILVDVNIMFEPFPGTNQY